MIARGHRVEIWAIPESDILKEAAHRRIPYQALAIQRKGLQGIIGLRNALAASRPDIVNAHSSTDAWLVALACLTMHDPPPMVRTRHISAPVPMNSPTRWLYTKATARIVTTGEALRRELAERNGFDASRIISIPTGIDTARFVPGDRATARAKLGLAQEGIMIGIVATLRSWKGHRFLLDAFARLPDRKARLVVVGDGPIRTDLEQQARALGLGERLIMPGNQRNVLPWFQALDIFVLPSYSNEGVPQAVMQAMACGLPVVTTDVGSIAEIVTPGVTGLMIAPRDAPALQAALEELLADPSHRAVLGAAAAKHAQRHFSVERMLNAMESLFMQVNEQRHG